MLCPNCGNGDTKVVDSRSSDDDTSIRRRRECLECGARFTTYERIEQAPVMILKKDGSVEPFDKQKLLRSLLTCTAKRRITLEQLTNLVQNVENEVREKYRKEVSSQVLGDTVLKHLVDLDKVAYIRFASVYKDFQNLNEFNEELSRLS